MNCQIVIVMVFGLLVCSANCSGDQAVDLANDKLKAHQIWDRVMNHGDDAALYEASALAAPTVVRMLSILALDRTTDPKRAAIALDVLRKVPGSAEYLGDKLSEATKKGTVDVSSFRILGMIATPEAVAVVAPYVFDFTSTSGRGDVTGDTNAFTAARTLGRMNLRNSPMQMQPNLYQSKEYIAWQTWAVDQGLVPAEWRERIGKDPLLKEIQAMESDIQLHPAPQATKPARTATPLRAVPTVPEPRKASEKSATPQSERERSKWPWVLGVAVGATLLMVLLARLLRKR